MQKDHLAIQPVQKELLESALKIFEDFFGQDHPQMVVTLLNLGFAEEWLGNVTRQAELLERVRALYFKMKEAFLG